MSASKTEAERASQQTAIVAFEPSGLEALERAVLRRRSVRGFTPERVPMEVLQRIFAVAQSTPSNCNVQPWRVYVASGAARDRVRDALVRAASAGQRPEPDFDRGATFTGVYRKHQVECGRRP